MKIRTDFFRTAVLSLLTGLLVAGCASKEAIPPPAPVTAKAAPLKQVTAPVNLGPVINSKLGQGEVSFTGDGKTMYFRCQVRPGRAHNDICVSRLIDTFEEGRWTAPEIVAPGVISLTETGELEPVISPDGKTLFFMSFNRPRGYGASYIFYSENVNGVWQAP